MLVASRGYDASLRKGDCFPFTILNMAVLTTLLVSQAGGTSVVMDRIDADGVAEWIARERVTVWNGPPALLHSLAGATHIGADELSTLHEVWTGGGDCPEAIRSSFQAKFGHPVVTTYGLSEAPTVVTIDPVGGPGVAGASGIPLPHLSVTVRDESGARCAPGETGEVCVGPAPGRRPLPTHAGVLEPAGRHRGSRWPMGCSTPATSVSWTTTATLHLRDRKSLMIIRGGANIYPAEVERIIHSIKGVGACVVFGGGRRAPGGSGWPLPLNRLPAAPWTSTRCVVCAPHNWRPTRCADHLVMVESLPRNAMGKIVRTELADLL